MKTGYRGTFVIAWHQIRLNGWPGADPGQLKTGAQLRWHGQAMRIDGMRDVLPLQSSDDMSVHHRAAQRVRQVLGAVIDVPDVITQDESGTQYEGSDLIITDGQVDYQLSIVDAPGVSVPLLMAQDNVPPANVDLQVLHCNRTAKRPLKSDMMGAGVICFTPGTRILTPYGPVCVEHLSEGDRVLTRDDGVQDIRWVGRRRMTGARLYAMPHLCPVRIQAGALGDGAPEQDLIVSPDHRMLLRGARAQELFNTDEVLVTARDLVDDRSISTLRGLREVTYIHLALDRHQIIWANGMDTETFHPASCDPSLLANNQREQLHEKFPEVAGDPFAYGDFARRLLTRAEAMIFRTDMGLPA